MHQFGRLSERGGNFLNWLQKKGGTEKGSGWGGWGWGVPQERRSSNLGGNYVLKTIERSGTSWQASKLN